MDVDKQQNKNSFIILTNLNKIDESKSEVFQDDNKNQSSSNANEDSSDDDEAMIKQESNYEGQGDHDVIKEENKKSNIKWWSRFFYHTKVISGVKGKSLLTKKILPILSREIINLEF